jgi:hypothetical protein
LEVFVEALVAAEALVAVEVFVEALVAAEASVAGVAEVFAIINAEDFATITAGVDPGYKSKE